MKVSLIKSACRRMGRNGKNLSTLPSIASVPVVSDSLLFWEILVMLLQKKNFFEKKCVFCLGILS